MKSDAVIVEIAYIGDFMFMFLGWDLECTLWDMFYIEYVTLSRLIVVYSRCRVNRGTNLSVVLYYVMFCYCFYCAFGLPCGVPNLWGVSPLWLRPLHIIWFRSSATQLPSKSPLPPQLTSPSESPSLESSKLAGSSFVCNKNAATCEEDGEHEESRESFDNDEEDDEDSETHQWEAFSASVFTLVNDLLCCGEKAAMTMLKSVW